MSGTEARARDTNKHLGDGNAETEVAVIGGGFAGLLTAARLQHAGYETMVLEAHSHAGGCAGYFRRKGFSFDVGATTLVDFEPGGIGAEFYDSVGMTPPPTEVLPGYMAWLPDRQVELHRDTDAWHQTRLAMLGDSDAHRRFWTLLDTLADVFWAASRKGVKLPMQGPGDLLRAARIVAPRHWLLARYAFMTVGDALRRHGLRNDKALVGLLSMLIEDTVHSTVDDAPLINAALGITIRGAGLARAEGGMRGFVSAVVQHYRSEGGRYVRNCTVTNMQDNDAPQDGHRWVLQTSKGPVHANRVVSAIPAAAFARIAPKRVSGRLDRYIRRDADQMGGAIVVFLGVPEAEVQGHEWTHHQILTDYDAPLGVGNNMFISVSAPGDTASAPPGHRAVMVSTHCDLDVWKSVDDEGYEALKDRLGRRLIDNARQVFPDLATDPVVYEVATPRTYARFTRRPDGAVGGVRQTLRNSNQFAIPHDIGIAGLHLVGDSTWPGLGTVACTIGSRIVTEQISRKAKPQPRTTKLRHTTEEGPEVAQPVVVTTAPVPELSGV